MADIKLVIKIPEDVYNDMIKLVKVDGNIDRLVDVAIVNGTPLEKHDEEIIKETVESIWGKPPCDDAISRKDVLVSIKNLYPDMPIVNIMGARQKWLEKYAPCFECENAIEQFPPVYPQVQSRRLKHALEIIDKYRGERNE